MTDKRDLEESIKVLQEIVDRFWKLDINHTGLDFVKIKAMEHAIDTMQDSINETQKPYVLVSLNELKKELKQ